MSTPIRDFGRVLQALFRFAKLASFTVIAVLGFFVALRVVEVHRFLAGIDFGLGLLFLAACGVGFVLLVWRPVHRFFSMPLVVRPPVLPPRDERRPRDLVRHLAFVERYLWGLRRNPEWEGTPAELREAVDRTRALQEVARRARESDMPELTEHVKALERETVARLLESLDRKARDVIRQEALGVGLATAVSWNGTVDAAIVLWRNSNLVSRLACIYYGRPGVRGTLLILRDVAAATVASACLQHVSRLAGSTLGGLFGRTVGAMGGPLLDGAVNAVVTLRIGYLAKARCRAFSAWTERTSGEAIRDAFQEAAGFSKDVVTDLVKSVGNSVLKLPGKIAGRVGQALSRS